LKAIPSRTTLERQFAKALLEYLKKENKRTLAAARKGVIYQPDVGMLSNVLRPYISQAAMIGAAEAMEPLIAFGLGFSELLVNEAAVEFARQHIYSGYGKGLAAQINDTTTAAIQKNVSTWIAEGDKIGELVQALEPTFGATRARTIAVTEVTNAISGSNIESWREVNRQLGADIVTANQWSTANDEHVCPICAPLGGLRYGEDGAIAGSIEQQEKRGVIAQLGGEFVHPGGNGGASNFEGRTYRRPPAHPRCRCELIPIIAS
jgi:hypothetical protein